MKYYYWVVSIAVIIALVMVSGCATTSFGNQQAGNFGSTADQQKAIDWFITTYGDPRGLPVHPRSSNRWSPQMW